MMERGLTERVFTDGSEANLIEYISQNPKCTNTRLFSFLTLLNAYVPDSYLPMQVCQQILGPPDPIDGGPPFEERMKRFTNLIRTDTLGQVSMCEQEEAQRFVEILDMSGINRSTIVKDFLDFLCRHEPQPLIVTMVKDLLIKREMGEKCREKFSRFISDILNKEQFYHAVSVLKTASTKLRHNAIYPQTIARLYYIEKEDTKRAAGWANTAIKKDPHNSYVADTLGQVYKNHLKRAWQTQVVCNYAKKSFRAFKDVEEKAMKEEDSQNVDPDCAIRTSVSFNNRGHFGFIQVAKMVFQKLCGGTFKNDLRLEVEEKFEFFEWYLTYSMLDMKTLEPEYFWKDIARCYEYYTGEEADSSTSFPGLLYFLSHGLFISRKRQAEDQRTTPELQGIVDDLRTTYQEHRDDVVTAMRYLLSNIILSNREPDAPQLARLTKLQSVIHRFFHKQPTQPPQPEFYLLALMLFWPDQQLQEVQQEADDEEEGQAAEDEESSDEDTAAEDEESNDEDTDEDQETEQEATQPPNLQQYVKFMKNAFECTYAKYLRGRYLLPQFFLGKGHGLSKWIHKSRLDAIVEQEVDFELAEQNNIKKKEMINDMWCEGKVWQVQGIKDLLLPVQVELQQIPEELEVEKVSVRVGEQEIEAKLEVRPTERSELFYLYFTIQGPVVINVSTPLDEQ